MDEARLSAVEADARAHSTGYGVVTWRDRIPEEFLDDRALLEQRMSTDAPHGDLPVEEERWDGERVRELEAMNAAMREFGIGHVTIETELPDEVRATFGAWVTGMDLAAGVDEGERP